jgi:hypothetical protein
MKPRLMLATLALISLEKCSLFPTNPSPNPSPSPAVTDKELSPAAICRGKYTPEYRTLWVPAVNSQAPEWEGVCVVSSTIRG